MARFRRTKDEIARGLTPSQALASRAIGKNAEQAKKRKFSPDPRGKITIIINPVDSVDQDYFEHLRDRVIEISQDNDFYKWLDHYLKGVYTTVGSSKLFKDMLDKGLGELISKVNFEEDIK